jgi:hypothetical protein
MLTDLTGADGFADDGGEPKIPDARIDGFCLKIDVFSFEGDGDAVGLWFTVTPPSVSEKGGVTFTPLIYHQ